MSVARKWPVSSTSRSWLRGGEPREQKGVVPDPVAGGPPFLDPRMHREAKGREDGHEDQEDEPRAETKEGKARHHALLRLYAPASGKGGRGVQ